MTHIRSFGNELKRLRDARGMTKYLLSDLSGVPESSLLRFESGERGAPEFGTVFNLTIGLDLPLPERQSFMKFSLVSRLLDEIDRWCIYYFLANVDDEGFEDIVRFINTQRRRKKSRGNASDKIAWYPRSRTQLGGDEIEEITLDRAYDVLVEIAENSKFVEQRRKIAAQILEWVNINVGDGSVGILSEDGEETLAIRADPEGLATLARSVLDAYEVS